MTALNLSGEQLILMLKTINDATNSNAMAIAALSQSLEGLRNQVLTTEQTWRVSREELHARLHRVQLEGAQGTGGGPPHGGPARSLIDPKTLVPEAFSGEPKTIAWRDWSYRLKSFVGAVQPTLQNAMERTEHKTTPVMESDFATLGINPVTVNELKAMLTQKIQGYAHTIIRQRGMSNGL